MSVIEVLWLCLAAFGAGAINSVAGGGTLLTFPALMVALGPSPFAAVTANATSTVAMLPGSAGSAWGYRQDFAGTRLWLTWLLAPSILGSLLGARLLVILPVSVFERLVPWLILTATLLLALQPLITRWIIRTHPDHPPSPAGMCLIVLFQTGVGIYGGYFGAGMGILMLSALSLMGLSDFHRMNALKSIFGVAINCVAAVIFAWSGEVAWKFAIPMAVAATLGGFWGAALARRLDRALVRRFVVGLGLALSVYYFTQVYMIRPADHAVVMSSSAPFLFL